MNYCKNCLQCDARPGISLNTQEICTGCEGHQEKENVIDWSRQRQELEKLFDQYRGSNGNSYDCIVPVSGGKDSTYQTYVVKELFGMNPLCVTYKTPLRTELGQKNLENLQQSLDVDLLELAINPNTEKKFILKAIKELGVPGLPQHLGIFAFTLRVAVKFRIPLVVWGENAQLEYGGTAQERQNPLLDRAWLARHGCLHERSTEDWVDADLSAKELQAFSIPSDEEFHAAGVHSFFLGQYMRWDPLENAQKAQTLGFQTRKEGPVIGIWDFADLDCKIIGLHHYVKWYKFGMTRTFDNVAVEIRNKRMTKEEGLRLIKEKGDDLPPADHIQAVCNFLEVSEHELFSYFEKFRNTNIWKRQNSDGSWYMPDYLKNIST